MYEVEFRIPTATYAYVNLKITTNFQDELINELEILSDQLALKPGQTGAALIGAVNHGHANPGAVPELTPEIYYTPEELIKSELSGKVIAVEAAQAASQQEPDPVAQAAQEEPSEAPSRPWNRQPETVQQKPWEQEPPVGTKVTVGGIEFTKKASLDDFFS